MGNFYSQHKGHVNSSVALGGGNGAGPEVQVYQSQTASDTNAIILIDNNLDRLSEQGFISDVTGNITSIDLRMFRDTSTVAGNFKLAIQADSSGLPSGTDLGFGIFDSTDLTVGSLPSSRAKFTFSLAAPVVATDLFHIVWSSSLTSGPGDGIEISYRNADIVTGDFRLSTDGVPTWQDPVALDIEYVINGD